MDDSLKWYLMKQNDGTVFGPMSFDTLRQWAVDALIAPLDKISSDGQHTWVKAPMIPELEMDFLLCVGPDSYYGPTTAGAVREFLANGEITLDSIVINCKSAEDGTLRDFGVLPELVAEDEVDQPMPVRSSIRENLQRRIRQLEEALVEERRLRQVSEGLRTKAEARVQELEELIS